MTSTDIAQTTPTPARASTEIRPTLSDRVIGNLWLKMTEIFDSAWTSKYGEVPGETGTTWAKGLVGITHAQLAEGLQRCLTRGREYPPNLVEFRRLCLGVPTLAAVRLEVRGMSAAQRSPFARLVWQFVDVHALRSSDRALAERILRDAYDLACTHVLAGGELPAEPRGAIEHTAPHRSPASPETARASIDACRQALGIRP